MLTKKEIKNIKDKLKAEAEKEASEAQYLKYYKKSNSKMGRSNKDIFSKGKRLSGSAFKNK